MSSGAKGILITIVVLALAGGAYLLLSGTKASAATISAATLAQLQDKVWAHMVSVLPELAPAKSAYIGTDAFKDGAYLQAWSNAIDNNAITFVYNNLTYKTTDGTSS